MIASKVMPYTKAISKFTRGLTLVTLLRTIDTITTDPMIDNRCTIAQIILITFANFLYFIASFRRRIAHRIDHDIKRSQISIANVEMVTRGVVSVGIELKVKN